MMQFNINAPPIIIKWTIKLVSTYSNLFKIDVIERANPKMFKSDKRIV